MPAKRPQAPGPDALDGFVVDDDAPADEYLPEDLELEPDPEDESDDDE